MDRHSKSSRSRWGDWSDWTLNDEYQRYYRVRQDKNGILDYQWDTESTPRSHDVDRVAGDMERLHMSGGGEVAADGYYTTNTTHHHQESRPRTERTSDRPKDKGKSKESSHRRDERHRRGRDVSDASESRHSDRRDVYSLQYEYGEESTRRDHRDYDRGGSSSSGLNPSYDTSYGGAPSALPTDYYQAPYTSQAYVQGSSRDYDLETAYTSGAGDFPRNEYGESSANAASSRNTYAEDAYDEGDLYPAVGQGVASAPQDENILLAEELDLLDPRYQIRHTNYFQPGEIFKVYWAEPKGSSGDRGDSAQVSDRQEVVNRFGEKFFVGFRRFVVVATESGSSVCVPILTYSGKACKKKGVKPEKHGIIYMKGKKARPLDGEPKLGFPPVACRMTEEGETISSTSRINYSKLVTIEHNIKVFFVGRLADDEQVDLVNDAVDAAWSARRHGRKHDGRRKG